MDAFFDPAALAKAVEQDGFALVPSSRFTVMLAPDAVQPRNWNDFASSWTDMPLDTYMADGGRYRRRRFGVFSADAAQPIRRAPHQAHFQLRNYNALNGGVERWFEPIPETVTNRPTFQGLLNLSRHLFEAIVGNVAWHIEAHQFRIEAGPATAGMPTPEGIHRDGVDFVLVLMVKRHNIQQGSTTILGNDRRELGTFVLAQPRDAAIVDDRRVFHGVTPVMPLDPTQPAYRDVLVLTYRALTNSNIA